MRRLRLLMGVLLALPVIACAEADTLPETEPRNVLFIGNSFTYYNNSLHNHYRALLKSGRPEVAKGGRGRIMTISGGRLPEHRAGLDPVLLAARAQNREHVVYRNHFNRLRARPRPGARDAVGKMRRRTQ